MSVYCIVGNFRMVKFTYSILILKLCCFFVVPWMNFCLLSLAVWSHMTTISSWQQLAASQTWYCSAKVYIVYSTSQTCLDYLRTVTGNGDFFTCTHTTHIHTHTHAHTHTHTHTRTHAHTHTRTAKDASALLKQLFLLATQFRYSCTSELIKAIEACTQHTFRW